MNARRIRDHSWAHTGASLRRAELPILMQLVAFGSKWYADIIFEDKVPRRLTEIFPQPKAKEIIMDIA